MSVWQRMKCLISRRMVIGVCREELGRGLEAPLPLDSNHSCGNIRLCPGLLKQTIRNQTYISTLHLLHDVSPQTARPDRRERALARH